MSETVVIALPSLIPCAERIASLLGADLVSYDSGAFARAWSRYRRIVAVMSTGIAVRGIATLLQNKWTDPAVVVVSPNGAVAIPLVGGHHGANDLARELKSAGILPVLTTATEQMGKEAVEVLAQRLGREVVNKDSTRAVNAAILSVNVPLFSVEGPAIVLGNPQVSFLCRSGTYAVGIGCRKGVKSEEVTHAITTFLAEQHINPDEVMIYATTQKKLGESGLSSAIRGLGGSLIYLEDDVILAHATATPSGATRIGLPGVAEPCALAVSRNRVLVAGKTVYGGVTLALAR